MILVVFYPQTELWGIRHVYAVPTYPMPPSVIERVLAKDGTFLDCKGLDNFIDNFEKNHADFKIMEIEGSLFVNEDQKSGMRIISFGYNKL